MSRRFWPIGEAAQADYEALRTTALAGEPPRDELAAARFARRGLGDVYKRQYLTCTLSNAAKNSGCSTNAGAVTASGARCNSPACSNARCRARSAISLTPASTVER